MKYQITTARKAASSSQVRMAGRRGQWWLRCRDTGEFADIGQHRGDEPLAWIEVDLEPGQYTLGCLHSRCELDIRDTGRVYISRDDLGATVESAEPTVAVRVILPELVDGYEWGPDNGVATYHMTPGDRQSISLVRVSDSGHKSWGGQIYIAYDADGSAYVESGLEEHSHRMLGSIRVEVVDEPAEDIGPDEPAIETAPSRTATPTGARLLGLGLTVGWMVARAAAAALLG